MSYPFCRQTSQRRCLSGPFMAACGPLGPENVSRQLLRLPAGFGCNPHSRDHSQVLERKHGGFLDHGKLAAIFATSESIGLFYLELFAEKGPGEAPVCPPCVSAPPRSGTGCCQPTSAGPATLSDVAWRPLWRKMALTKNSWAPRLTAPLCICTVMFHLY
jgi:hypothetical protein